MNKHGRTLNNIFSSFFLCVVFLFQVRDISPGIHELIINTLSEVEILSHSQTDEYDPLFFEDFDDHQMTGWKYTVSDWQIITDDISASRVLMNVSDETTYASVGSTAWSDYIFRSQVRRVSGVMNLYFRVKNGNGYALRIEEKRIVLWTERSGTPQDLAYADYEVGSIWHAFEIQATGKQISIRVDDEEMISFTDGEQASLSGGVSLEVIAKGEGRFDDLEVVNTAAQKEHADQWVQTGGPLGGLINTIEMDPVDPDTMYIGGVGGIYKTTSSGDNWMQQTNFFSTYGTVDALLVDPNVPSTVYAESGRLFKSLDAGETWFSLFEGNPVNCVAMDPENPNQLLLGDVDGKIWISTDGGSTWQNISSNYPGYSIKALAFGGVNELWIGTAILNGTGNGYIYHSVDNGKTWHPIDMSQAETSEIHSIFVDPHDRGVVYVGLRDIHNEMFDAQEDIYLLKTSDAGKNWQVLHLPHTDAMVNIIGSTSHDSTIYLGTGGYFFSSSDAGQTWNDVSPLGRNGDMYDIAVDPDDPDNLYLPRRAYGIVRSSNGGKEWTPINQGLLNTTISLIALGDASGSTIYVTSVNGEGTYKSTDSGSTWENITFDGITHPWADEIAVSPVDPQTIWEVADVGEVFISTNGGETWTKSVDTYGAGFRAGTISASAVSPSNSDVIYTLKSGFGIYKSENRGLSWSFLHQSEVDYTYSLAVNPTNPDIIFSGDTPKPFQDRARVQRSSDGGATWSTVLTVPNSSAITSVAIDPQDSNTVYAGSTGESENGGGQIYQSTDNGGTWTALNPHFTMLTVWGQPQLVGDPNDPSVVYAATWLAGTWKSTDAGQSWMKLENAPLSVTSLSIDPSNTDVIYAASRTAPQLWKSMDGGSTWKVTADFSSDRAFLLNRVFVEGNTVYASTFGPGIHDGKLYRSTDQGATWTDITNGLPRSVLDITVDPSDSRNIFVTTHIYGAYRSSDGGMTWSEMKNFPDIGAYDIEVDAASPNILFAAGLGGSVPDWVLEGGYSFTDTAGVYKSTDSGQTWKQILTTSNECRAIRIHPTNHDLLLVSALSDGFFVSTDGGENWTTSNAGLDSTNLTSVWVNEKNIYVGTQGFGIYSGDLDISSGKVTWSTERSNKPVPDVYNLQI